MLPDADILAVGISGNDYGEIVLGELSAGGSANTAFGSGGLATLQAYGTYLAVIFGVLTDGEIYIGGLAGDPLGDKDIILAEFTSDGELDTTYGKDGTNVMELSSSYDPWAMTLLASGDLLLVGSKSGKLYVADITP